MASPHSETTLPTLANTGVALAILVACLAAADAFPRLRRLARPDIAVDEQLALPAAQSGQEVGTTPHSSVQSGGISGLW